MVYDGDSGWRALVFVRIAVMSKKNEAFSADALDDGAMEWGNLCVLVWRVSDNIVALRTQPHSEAEGIMSIRRDLFQIEQQFACGPERPPDSAHGSRRLPWVRSKEEPCAPAAGAGDRGFSHPLRGAALIVE